MIERTLKTALQNAARMPVVALTGPRQSGKTTLVRDAFPDHEYVNLEFPDVRARVQEDPRLFLTRDVKGLILDEIQRAPDLLSYIQGLVDEKKQPGRFILTGSQNLMVQEKVSQSLAGRVSLLNLLPFDIEELTVAGKVPHEPLEMIFKGGYPRLYDENLSPTEWLPSYIQTYIERDLRQIINVKDLGKFQIFLRLCAGRVGQLFNASSLAGEIGVDYKTIQAWLSVLQASYIIFLLYPYHKNFNKRLVKSPKLYFYDSGLVCSLLGIRSPDDLSLYPLKGEIFESFVIAELNKVICHRRLASELYFWRDSSGHEIDVLIDQGTRLIAVEIKSGMTIHPDFFKNLIFWQSQSGALPDSCRLIYGGTENQMRTHGSLLSWQNLTACLHE
jgi:uncharacterized protein